LSLSKPVPAGERVTAYFTLTTTSGNQAVIPVPAGCDRWLVAVRYVNEYCSRDNFLADVQTARPQEVAAFQAEHPHAHLEWLARDL
jgi:hypothetical protein